MTIATAAPTSSSTADLQEQIDAASPGAVIELPSGVFVGALVIPRAITLRGAGAGKTVIDAKGRGAVVAVDAADAEVILEALTLTRGKSRLGGGVSIDNGARVQLVRVAIEDCTASGAGGAVAVERGEVTIRDSRLSGNRAKRGGAVFASGSARVELVGSVLSEGEADYGGALAIGGQVHIELVNTRLTHNRARVTGHHLYTYGAPSAAPKVRLESVTFEGHPAEGNAVDNTSPHPATIELVNTVWPAGSANPPKVRRGFKLGR